VEASSDTYIHVFINHRIITGIVIHGVLSCSDAANDIRDILQPVKRFNHRVVRIYMNRVKFLNFFASKDRSRSLEEAMMGLRCGYDEHKTHRGRVRPIDRPIRALRNETRRNGRRSTAISARIDDRNYDLSFTAGDDSRARARRQASFRTWHPNRRPSSRGAPTRSPRHIHA